MFAFSQIDPRTNGQVTDMEVPLSRYLGAAAAEGQNDSMFNSVRQWREMSLESSDPAGKILQPEEANKTYGLPGLKWDKPVKENVASLMNTRHQAALDRAYFLSQDNHTLVAGALGMGTQMMSAMMNPLDLGAMFIPFVGEAKTANVLGRGTLRTAIARGLISHEAFAEAIPRGTELARSVVQGGAYMGMAQTPIIANRMAEGGPGPGLQDLESIGMGSIFAAGMHLGISGAARAFKFLDPGTREAAFKKAVDDFAKGQDTDVSDIAKVGMEPEKPVAVAWKDESGVVHKGSLGEIHPSLRERLHQEGVAGLGELGEDGFITNHGNFLNREEAFNLVFPDQQGQAFIDTPETGKLTAEDFNLVKKSELDSIQMSGVDEVNFGTSTRLAKAGDVEGLTKYLIAHGAPGDSAAREYALAWIEKERTKDPTKLNAIQARENGFSKQEGKILSQPVIEEKQGHSITPEDAEIAQVKEDAAELRRQLEEAAKESGMEVGEPQITAKVPEPGDKTSAVEKIVNKPISRRGFLGILGKAIAAMQTPGGALELLKSPTKEIAKIPKSIHTLLSYDASDFSQAMYDFIKGTKKLSDLSEDEKMELFGGSDAESLSSWISKGDESVFSEIDPPNKIEAKELLEQGLLEQGASKEDLLNLTESDWDALIKSGYDTGLVSDLWRVKHHVTQDIKKILVELPEGIDLENTPVDEDFFNKVKFLSEEDTSKSSEKLLGDIKSRLSGLFISLPKIRLKEISDKVSESVNKVTEALPKSSEDHLAFVKQKGKLGKQGFYTIKDPRISGFSMQVEPDKITLVNLSVAEKGKGLGGEIIERVKKLADEQNLPVELIAHPDTPEMQQKLDSFYKKHGFVEGENRTWRYEPEKVVAVAFKRGEKIYAGKPGEIHGDLEEQHGIFDEKNSIAGFMTNRDRFVNREEAAQLSNKKGSHDLGGLDATQLSKEAYEKVYGKPATDSIKAAADCLKKKIL